jgi:phosphodiester glycosidase
MLAPVRASVEPVRPHARASRRQRGPGASRWHRVRRILVAAAALCLTVSLVSYVQALTEASNASVGIRTVEWLRDNGARGLVNRVESIYYSLNSPAKGGPGLRSLPTLPGVDLTPAVIARAHVHYYRPRRVKPVLSPPLPGEGVWRATFAGAGSRPPVLVTSFRSDPAYPRVVAGVAWIDHTRTSTWLYPGRLEPGVSLASRGPMEVPPRLRPRLVATFNSGFKLKDAGGGFAVGGHTYAPLKPDLATFLRYRDGSVDIKAWSGGADVGPDIIYARQNLPLIVNHGRPNPNLSDGPEWGFTLGNAIRVWRSGVGVDRRGNLVYAAASDQTVGSLAAIMIRAGAVRAMELDINTYWTSFITYHAAGAQRPTNLLPTMDRPPQRYLTPDDRDFFAVYLR